MVKTKSHLPYLLYEERLALAAQVVELVLKPGSDFERPSSVDLVVTLARSIYGFASVFVLSPTTKFLRVLLESQCQLEPMRFRL